MGRLTPDERRRVHVGQQQASREMLARLSAPVAATERSPRYRLARVVKTAMLAALLGGTLFAYHTIEFHVPASIVEALLPRLQSGS